MVVEYVSDTDQVRKLARNVLLTEFSDEQIQEEQKSAFTDIGLATQKYDWDINDLEFPSVQKLEQKLAAKYLIEYYGDGNPDQLHWMEMWTNDVKEGLMTLSSGMSGASSSDIIAEQIERTTYKSWNLNPSYPYRSRLSGLGTGIESKTSFETDT